MLVGGSAKIKLDDEVIELEPWDTIRVSADDARLRGGSRGGRVHTLRGAQYRKPRRRAGVADPLN